MVTVCLEFKTSKPFLTTMKIMVLKYLISHKLTFKKQNLYKKFEAYLRIKKQKKPQKTQKNKDTLEKTEHTHSSH